MIASNMRNVKVNNEDTGDRVKWTRRDGERRECEEEEYSF